MGRQKGHSILLLCIMAAAFKPARLQGRSGESTGVQILEPRNLARLWVDEEHPVEIRLHVEPEGEPWRGHVRISVNGRDSGVRVESVSQQLKIDALDDGIHVMVAQMFDDGGRPIGRPGMSTFYSRRYLELIEHEDYPISAEAPRADGSANGMPGIEEWDLGAGGWDDWAEDTEDELLVREAWGRRSGTNDKPWNARNIFRVYAEYHQQVGHSGIVILCCFSPCEQLPKTCILHSCGQILSFSFGHLCVPAWAQYCLSALDAFLQPNIASPQVMSNRTLWSNNDFLIYRTMDRGMGNQLESLVSAYVFALLTNRWLYGALDDFFAVFLVILFLCYVLLDPVIWFRAKVFQPSNMMQGVSGGQHHHSPRPKATSWPQLALLPAP